MPGREVRRNEKDASHGKSPSTSLKGVAGRSVKARKNPEEKQKRGSRGLTPDGNPHANTKRTFRESPKGLDQKVQTVGCGGVLLSHTLPGAVPSPCQVLASGFGMGPGVSPGPWPPQICNYHPTGSCVHVFPCGGLCGGLGTGWWTRVCAEGFVV